MTPSLAELQDRLPGLMLRDQRRLGRRAEQAAALPDPAAREHALERLRADLEAAQARADARRASVPVLRYPAELPVSQRRDEIAAAIRDHQVVIVAGETGSGKTTQLPKICLELGRGVTGQIGHTQPRRIAARTVAERIASELGTELGTAIGYKVRFTDTSSDSTLVKVMTDGILLTEMARDRQLLRYDTLIIDEAHERSLNIDFILGYLKRLLPRRPDLKVIITSATIDPQRFAEHFKEFGAPVIEVSGRTYPVEVRYRPLADPDDPDQEPKDQVQGILDAVTELSAHGPGDILVFLSGEREIRDTADALDGQAGLEVLPLYARLSAAEQHRVFDRKDGQANHFSRRVVLATNVAETSLTVPGIKYVIDPGTARISRYSQRTKVQRLPIEPISQASANQRKGRCGRTSDGVCIRLYSEADFESRPEFTDPEILRTNLASVILQMAALDLGDMADFPFVEPPESRNVADGVRLLEELGAFSPGHDPGRGRTRLTEVGRKLSRLPLDPRLGRMILEAARNGCVREVLIITAALSIIDPRERPADARQAADEMHARFAEPGSDFLTFLNLWDYLRERQSHLSGSAFRRLCRREYLHYLRVREWQDVYGQLRQAAADLGIQAGRERGGTSETPGQPPVQPPGQRSGEGQRGPAGPGRGPAGPCRPPHPRPRPGTPGRVAGSRPSWPTGSTCPCSPGCCRTSACRTRTAGRAASGGRWPSSPGRAAPGSRSSPTRRWPGSPRSGWSRPNWWRRPGCGPGSRPASNPNGPSRWPRTWSGAATASRDGTHGAARRWPPRRSACTGCRSWPPGRSCTAGSTRRPPGTCSSRMPWWRATGRPTTSSSPATSRCSPTRRTWNGRRGGAGSSPTTRPCSRSTTGGSRPRSPRRGTSTPGGRRPAPPTRPCWTCPPTT